MFTATFCRHRLSIFVFLFLFFLHVHIALASVGGNNIKKQERTMIWALHQLRVCAGMHFEYICYLSGSLPGVRGPPGRYLKPHREVRWRHLRRMLLLKWKVFIKHVLNVLFWRCCCHKSYVPQTRECYDGVQSYEAGQDKKWKNNATNKAGEIAKRVLERSLKWYGHVMRRDELYRKEGDGNKSRAYEGGEEGLREDGWTKLRMIS